MMGLATGSSGKLHMTDMDTIEISNLSRQFLFREQHVGKLKAEVAHAAAKAMNPDMNIISMTTKVALETDKVLNNQFWYSLDGVARALDNYEARAYIDRRCLFFQKPFIDSATTATQCTTKVIQPKLTTSWVYGSAIPTEETFLLCTVHALPTKIDHTIHYARYIALQELFVDDINNITKWLSTDGYLESLMGAQQKVVLKSLSRSLRKENSFTDCVEWAYRYFEQEFSHKPFALLHRFPRDFLLPDGAPIWTGMHSPTPLEFDLNNPLHVDFVIAAAYLRAYTQGIISSELKADDVATWNKIKSDIKQQPSTLEKKPWVPPANAPAPANPTANLQQQLGETQIGDDEVKAILASLPDRSSFKETDFRPIDFEKDDDRNFHIDFVYAMSSLKASVYGINQIDRLRLKSL